MMNETVRWTVRGAAFRAKPRSLGSRVTALTGGVVTTLALAAGIAVAVVFAATLAVILMLATALLALYALAWRTRPRPVALVASQRAGHAWVDYRWDRSSR